MEFTCTVLPRVLFLLILNNYTMTQQEIKVQSTIKTKSFDISIGERIDQVGLISQSTDEFTPLSAIRKGGKLAKIKRKFRSKLASSTHFFFEGFSEEDTLQLIKLLK